MRVVDDVVLSPKEAEPDSAELNLSEMGLSVVAADWGESGVEGNAVRTSTGQQMVDRQPKVTTSVLKLAVREDADVDLATAAYRLQQKVGEMQRSRRWLRRDFYIGSFAGSLLCIVTGEVTLADIGGWQAGQSPDVTLTFVRNPTWYSTEETESETFVEETERELIYTPPVSKGTVEGLKRIRVKNLNTSDDWRGLIYAGEVLDAPLDLDDPTAQLSYAARDLTPVGGAKKVTVLSVPTVEHKSLTPGWLTVLDSEIVGVGHMTHRGPRRLWVRAYDNGDEPGGVELRVRCRALGSLRWSEDSPIKPTLVVDAWQWYDMGEFRPQRGVLGDERWQFQIQARAPGGAGTIRLHRVAPLPTEQYMVLRALDQSRQPDNQETNFPGTVEEVKAGATAAAWKSADNVKTSDGANATVDFEDGEELSYRLLVRDLGFGLPEDAHHTGTVLDVLHSAPGGDIQDYEVRLLKDGSLYGQDKARKAEKWPHTDAHAIYGASDDSWEGVLTPADINSALFGAAIQCTGKSGTAQIDSIQITVYYTEAADENRVCFAQRCIELRSDGVYRQHPDDDVWGEVVPDGFLPVAVPGGLEEKQGRCIIIPTQGDLGSVADAGSNALSAEEMVRNGYHFARESAS